MVDANCVAYIYTLYCIYIYSELYSCIHTCIRVCIHMRTCMQARKHAHMNTYTHTHTHTNTCTQTTLVWQANPYFLSATIIIAPGRKYGLVLDYYHTPVASSPGRVYIPLCFNCMLLCRGWTCIIDGTVAVTFVTRSFSGHNSFRGTSWRHGLLDLCRRVI